MVPKNSEMAKIWLFVDKIWPFLAKIDSFEGFVPDLSNVTIKLPNFWFPDVFRLRKEPINSLSCVRAYVRAFRSYSRDRSIFFFDFLHEVVSPYDLDDHQKFFRSKNFLTPKMAKNFCQNSHF